MSYNRKTWIDHIEDNEGNIIQQGTPLSAQNMNNIEAGISENTEQLLSLTQEVEGINKKNIEQDENIKKVNDIIDSMELMAEKVIIKDTSNKFVSENVEGALKELMDNKWDNSKTSFSKGDNGYYKLPNGLLIQWGVYKHNSSYYGVTVNYPIKFPTKVCYIGITQTVYTSTYIRDGCNSSNVTTTNFTLYSPQNAFWFAIGY